MSPLAKRPIHLNPASQKDTMTDPIHKSLASVATVHGIDCTAILADCVEHVETTLLSFRAESVAKRVQNKARKTGDDLTSDDCAAIIAASQDANRDDRRTILKRAVTMSRRERSLAVVAGLKGY